MMLVWAALAAVLCAAPQEPAEKSAKSAVDPKLHADAARLVELSGARERMQEGVDQLLKDLGAKFNEKCKGCDPAAGLEWSRRMKLKIKVEDLLDIMVRAYEKYLTDEEINQLISLMTDQKRTSDQKTSSGQKSEQPRKPLPELQQKLTTVMPALQGEIIGGGAQLGAALGTETELEIRKEHPEYFPAPDK
jgi:hypothetical protein